MKKSILFLLIIILALIIFSSFFWLYEAKYFIGRASTIQTEFSLDNSYVFVSPLQAKADSQEKIRITVFILNNQGLGVMGKKVNTSSDPNLTMSSTQSTTDEYGKAIFDVSANKAGEYYLEMTVDNTALKQKAHLTYY